jgi:hypothetical protein
LRRLCNDTFEMVRATLRARNINPFFMVIARCVMPLLVIVDTKTG